MTDRVYEAQRNALIPKAEKHAYKITENLPRTGNNKEAWNNAWNFAFHSKMNELAKLAGITK